MRYVFYTEDKPDTPITLEQNTLSGKCKVFINESEAEVVNKRQKVYNLKFNDGTSNLIKIKPGFAGLSLDGYIDDKKIQITPPLAWYEYVLCLLPIFLLAGGAIGGALAAVGICFNVLIIRGNKSIVKKVICSVGITLIAFIIYLIFASAISSALNF